MAVFKSYRLTDNEIDDVIQDGAVSIIKMYQPITERTKLNLFLKCIGQNLIHKYRRRRTELKYAPYLFNSAKINEEMMLNQFDYLVMKELSKIEIDIPVKKKVVEKVVKKLHNRGQKVVLREDGLIFESTAEAARYMKMGKSSISNAINNKWRCGGFRWSFLNG